MKKLLFAGVSALTAFAATPAQAVIIAPGTSGLTFTNFATIAATQGSQIAFTQVSGSAFTFAATMRAAVYRNTLGTLDFYFQVDRTGAGTDGDEEITQFTASNFLGWIVDGYVSAADPDGAGAFKAANNPTPAGGSTTTVGRSPTGSTLQTDFHGSGLNGLIGTENSATYIFRTNASAYGGGTWGIIDGSTLSGRAFAPIPEPAAWGMMIGGLALAGGALRYRRRRTAVVFS